MGKFRLLLLVASLAGAAAHAQPSSTFPMRKACRDIMPQILDLLNAQQVSSLERVYVYTGKSGSDTLRLNTDSLPQFISIQGKRFTARFELYSDRLLVLNHANATGGWTLMNPNGLYRHDMALRNLEKPTLDRFLLEAVATGYMYQTSNTEAKRIEKPIGSPMAVTYFYIPTRGMDFIIQADKEGRDICPTEDGTLKSAGVEIAPFGSTLICYRKRR